MSRGKSTCWAGGRSSSAVRAISGKSGREKFCALHSPSTRFPSSSKNFSIPKPQRGQPPRTRFYAEGVASIAHVNRRGQPCAAAARLKARSLPLPPLPLDDLFLKAVAFDTYQSQLPLQSVAFHGSVGQAVPFISEIGYAQLQLNQMSSRLFK